MLFYFILLVVICGAAGFGTSLFCNMHMKFIPAEERGSHTGITYGVFIGGAAVIYTTIFWRISATISASKSEETVSTFANGFAWFVIIVVLIGVACFFGYIKYMAKKGKEKLEIDSSSLDATTNIDDN